MHFIELDEKINPWAGLVSKTFAAKKKKKNKQDKIQIYSS